MRELTRTEEILYHLLMSYRAQSETGQLTDKQVMHLVERAANEIKAKIPIYRPEELAEKLEGK